MIHHDIFELIMMIIHHDGSWCIMIQQEMIQNIYKLESS